MSQDIFFAGSRTPIEQILTKLAFMSRLHDAEYAAFLSALKTDVALELWYEKFKLLNNVDLNDFFIVSGLQLMVQKNVMTQERADVILKSDVAEFEKPK